MENRLLATSDSDINSQLRQNRVSVVSVCSRFIDINGNDDKGKYDEDNEAEYVSSTQFRGNRTTQYLAAFAANMGALALGTVLTWPAVALPDLRKDPNFLQNLTANDESWIGSTAALGAVAAGPAGGLLIEWIGRRTSMLFLAIPFFLGWIIIHFAQSIQTVLLGRFLTGFFAGTFAVAAPIFIAEVADVGIRGALGSTNDLMTGLGILFIYILGTFVSWRTQALICSVIPLVIFSLMAFVPESPYYLIKKGRVSDAKAALMKYRGATTVDEIEAEFDELESAAAYSREGVGGLQGAKDLMIPSILIPVSIGFFIYMLQVISGVDPVLIYTVDIFHSAGADLDDYTSTIIIGSMQVVAGLIAALVVDKSGRRFLLLISEAFMIVSLTFLGLYFYLKNANGGVNPVGMGWLPLIALSVYVISFAVGLGPVGDTLMGEILPLRVKGLAVCIITSAQWFMSFLVTRFFQDLIEILGTAGCFWLFAGFCLMGFFYIWKFVPETKGKSLEEIQLEFRRKFKGVSSKKLISESSPLLLRIQTRSSYAAI